MSNSIQSISKPLSRPTTPTASNAPQSSVKKTAFVHKLYSMLQDESISHLIWWSRPSDPNVFAINPGSEFSQVLTTYFKHGNVSSFVRQLHMYGFHKVFDENEGNNIQGINNNRKEVLWEFRHSTDCFKRGDESGLVNIKRRSSNRNTSEADQAIYNQERLQNYHLQQQQYQLQQHQYQQQQHQHHYPQHQPLQFHEYPQIYNPSVVPQQYSFNNQIQPSPSLIQKSSKSSIALPPDQPLHQSYPIPLPQQQIQSQSPNFQNTPPTFTKLDPFALQRSEPLKFNETLSSTSQQPRQASILIDPLNPSPASQRTHSILLDPLSSQQLPTPHLQQTSSHHSLPYHTPPSHRQPQSRSIPAEQPDHKTSIPNIAHLTNQLRPSILEAHHQFRSPTPPTYNNFNSNSNTNNKNTSISSTSTTFGSIYSNNSSISSMSSRNSHVLNHSSIVDIPNSPISQYPQGSVSSRIGTISNLSTTSLNSLNSIEENRTLRQIPSSASIQPINETAPSVLPRINFPPEEERKKSRLKVSDLLASSSGSDNDSSGEDERINVGNEKDIQKSSRKRLKVDEDKEEKN
ncbi:hypothetical protein WICMUC_003426 [Wickerhamomyces mucosus]|uniref:Heat shock transcription factor n=1 Tax=Wickerhamomyces mucosus TaxID=1378264 RepID=A0A9P8PML7_9ASCO|nr:hypothetical protein WICMUC_003426 [Wickerhamomyces mucosus]